MKNQYYFRLVAESLVILEYIDETWKHNPILPTDPYEKALARFWARFIDEKVNLTLFSFFFFLKNKNKIHLGPVSLSIKLHIHYAVLGDLAGSKKGYSE